MYFVVYHCQFLYFIEQKMQITHNKNFPIIPFLILTLILLIGLGIALSTISKAELHLLLCQPHNNWLDRIVPAFSNLVDWLPYVTIISLLFYRACWSTFLASNMLLTTAIVQPIKHLVNAPRPVTWFAENCPDITLPLVEGVKMNTWLSFPSGHTTTFFALFFTLSIILYAENIKGKHMLSFLAFLAATFGAYTRIYLSQHFALDIFAGICIAVLCTVILYYLLVLRIQNTRFGQWNLQNCRK